MKVSTSFSRPSGGQAPSKRQKSCLTEIPRKYQAIYHASITLSK